MPGHRSKWEVPILSEFNIARDMRTTGFGMLLAPSGAGKTTFLRRLAWEMNPKRYLAYGGSPESIKGFKRFVLPCYLKEVRHARARGPLTIDRGCFRSTTTIGHRSCSSRLKTVREQNEWPRRCQ